MSTSFERAVASLGTGGDAHLLARGLVEEMTLDEKLGCLDGDSPFWPGLIDMSAGGYYRHAWPAARVESLGIPGIDFADGPRGCVIGDATAFPVSMARGASFDPELEERIGDAIGTELRASGATFTGAVCMNLLRHPGWGRAQETYGEDPHHVGTMAAALVEGLQGQVMACMKHFALNSMENARFRVDVSVDERSLHEVYLPHFRRVAASGVASVMSAYNSVEGEWCGENTMLLTDILRDEWGWDGFVISDFIFGLRDPVASVTAGLDIEMPFRQQRAMTLRAALERGELTIDDVDAAAERIVSTLLRFARVFGSRPPLAEVGCKANRALAREASSASMVLLSNAAGLLPVDVATVGKVAVLGRLARVPNLGDGGSSDVRTTTVTTLLDGLREGFSDVVHDDADASVAAGADLVVVVVGTTKHEEGEYLDTAGTAGLVAELFPPGDHPELGQSAPGIDYDVPHTAASTALPGDTTDGDLSVAVQPMTAGGDRRSLRLPAADEALIAAAVDGDAPVVVVVMGGSAFVMPWANSVDAVIMCWYPGELGGAALFDVISGRVEPGGRLPFAIPTDESDLVEFDPDAAEATYGLFHGQWKLDRDEETAHFPFGWGLGYTTLTIVGAQLDRAGEGVGEGAGEDAGETVRVTLHNDGDRPGSTVVFAHAGMPSSEYERPPRRLIGFRKVTLDVDQRLDVEIELDWTQLDIRREGGWLREPGEYLVDIGRHAQDPDAMTLIVERR